MEKSMRTVNFRIDITSARLIACLICITGLLFTDISNAKTMPSIGGVDDTQMATENNNPERGGLALTVNNYGIAFGNVPVVHGLRFNLRDINLNQVNGANITILAPREPSYGTVRGLALGLPMTGGASITGVSVALGGITVEESISGIQFALLGIGAGTGISGITVAGLGFGAAGNVSGINLAGLGLGVDGNLSGITVTGLGFGSDGNVAGINYATLGFGAGENVSGINIAGLGFGAGGHVTGLSAVLLGFGAGDDVRGVSFAGLGIGTGGSVTGISVAGLGLASGDAIRGISLAGIGIASGESVCGIAFAGLGIASQQLRGITVSPGAAAMELARGAFFAPAYFRIEDGTLQGVSVSAFNHILGQQQGITIGLYNYARNLKGVQIGVMNYAANNPRGLRLLPLVNANL